MVNFRICLKKYLLLVLFFVLGGGAEAAELVFSKIVFQIEIAQTQEALQKGLMNVKHLPEKTGMLFDLRLYEDYGVSMWMKNTYIPLDMVFLSCGFEIVDIYKNAKPLSLDKISSPQRFCYVLEINGGESDKYHLTIGQTAVLKSQPLA